MLEKIAVGIIAAFLFSLWCLWYNHNSAVVDYCMNNLAACEAAYYTNNN